MGGRRMEEAREGVLRNGQDHPNKTLHPLHAS